MRLLGFATGLFLIALAFFLMADSDAIKIDKKPIQASLDGATKVMRDKFLMVQKFWTGPDAADRPETIRPESVKSSQASKAVKSVKSEAAPLEKPPAAQEKSMPRADPEPLIALKDKEIPPAPPQTFQSKSNNAKQTQRLEQAKTDFAPPKEPFMAKPQWHLFWGPFKTQSSAKGFAQNLAKRTELTIEVVKTKPGVYMIGYPYSSEAERQALAVLIEERTGLQLSARE